MTVVLGLDLGTEGGFARYDTVAGDLLLGRLGWGKHPPEDRIVFFGEWLERALAGVFMEPNGQFTAEIMGSVDVLGFERVSFSGPGRGSEYISRQEGVAQYLARRIAWQGVQVPTLKKFATDDGRAEKPTMVAAAEYGIRVLGHEPPLNLNHNVADAFLVTAWILVNSIPGWTAPAEGREEKRCTTTAR